MKIWPINHKLWVLNLSPETKLEFSTLHTHFIKCHHSSPLFLLGETIFLKAASWSLRGYQVPSYKVIFSFSRILIICPLNAGLSMNGIHSHLHAPTHASIYLDMLLLNVQNFTWQVKHKPTHNKCALPFVEIHCIT